MAFCPVNEQKTPWVRALLTSFMWSPNRMESEIECCFVRCVLLFCCGFCYTSTPIYYFLVSFSCSKNSVLFLFCDGKHSIKAWTLNTSAFLSSSSKRLELWQDYLEWRQRNSKGTVELIPYPFKSKQGIYHCSKLGINVHLLGFSSASFLLISPSF